MEEIKSDDSKYLIQKTQSERSDKMALKLSLSILFVFLSVFIILGTWWAFRNFSKLSLSVDSIIFCLTAPSEGVNSEIVMRFITRVVVPAMISSIVYAYVFLICKRIANKRLENKKGRAFINWVYRRIILLTSMVFILCLGFALFKFDIVGFAVNQIVTSTYIEDNYVSPQEVEISFDNGKRNLVYILLESMEASFLDKENGGAMDTNLIPEILELSKDAISFTNEAKLGGAKQVNGISWTVASMVAQSAGLPLKIQIDNNSYGGMYKFMPGVISIGDILNDEGYKQVLMIGSNATFGGRQEYYLEHGNYEIMDYAFMIENNILPKDYHVWWGFEDAKLYSYAKEKLLSLASQNQPFNFTMLTVDSHHPNGYKCELCPNTSDVQLENIISCASKQVYEFVNWIKEQDFYENTTVVIVGDHLHMNADYFEKIIPEEYIRTTVNLFINSKLTPDDTNRDFSNMDMFPTILTSIGANISGNKLGLGSNLFSNEQTLIERDGFDKVNNELKKTSIYYNNKFLYNLYE